MSERLPLRAPRGPTISCRNWLSEAALRMLMNNLDPEVAERPDELDEGIRRMIESDKPVLFDVRVTKDENCFPMIPSGKAHNEMILAEAAVDLDSVIDDEGRIMV